MVDLVLQDPRLELDASTSIVSPSSRARGRRRAARASPRSRSRASTGSPRRRRLAVRSTISGLITSDDRLLFGRRVHEDAPLDTDLRSREADARGGTHRLAHVLDELAHVVVDHVDGLRRLAQDGVREHPDLTDRHHIRLTMLRRASSGPRRSSPVGARAANARSGSSSGSSFGARTSAVDLPRRGRAPRTRPPAGRTARSQVAHVFDSSISTRTTAPNGGYLVSLRTRARDRGSSDTSRA